MNMNRRAFLKASGATTAAVGVSSMSGCASIGGASGPELPMQVVQP